MVTAELVPSSHEGLSMSDPPSRTSTIFLNEPMNPRSCSNPCSSCNFSAGSSSEVSFATSRVCRSHSYCGVFQGSRKTNVCECFSFELWERNIRKSSCEKNRKSFGSILCLVQRQQLESWSRTRRSKLYEHSSVLEKLQSQ